MSNELHPTSVLNLGSASIIDVCEPDEDESDSDSDSSSSEDLPAKLSKTSKNRFNNKFLRSESEAVGEDAPETVESVCEHCESTLDKNFTLVSAEMPVFDEQILKLDWVTDMSLHNNRLAALPETLSALKNLTSLKVTANLLKTLPAAIGSLKSLTRLDMNHNTMDSLPDEISQLTNLKMLNLDYNKFTDFPAQVFKLTQLETLCMVENFSMKSLGCTEGFGGFKELTVHLDNYPPVCKEWQALGSKYPNVHMDWHKIFPDRVTDNLFIGSLRSAQEQRVYDELKIGHVLTCGTGMSIYLSENMDQLQLALADTVEEKLSGHLQKGIEYISNAVKKDERVLVHCFAGLSRSASMVCAYLMKENMWTFEKSLEVVRKGRPNAHPNAGFQHQLKLFEAELGIKG